MTEQRTADADPIAFETQSTLTDRYQTTVPEAVRRALQLGKRDKIRFCIRSDGRVELARAAPSETGDEDPVLARFLAFLADDMAQRPGDLRALDADLAERVRALVGGIDVDLDQPLSDDDE